MKNLTAAIKTAHTERRASINQIKKATRDILADADDYMKRVGAELKEMAGNLKDFLAKSEDARKKDFNAMMGGIQARIKEIQGDIKDLLAKSEEQRMVDFKAVMKDVAERIKEVVSRVEEIKKNTKEILGDYKAERKEAAGYWATLKKRGAVPAEVEEVKAEEKPAEKPEAKKKKK